MQRQISALNIRRNNHPQTRLHNRSNMDSNVVDMLDVIGQHSLRYDKYIANLAQILRSLHSQR